MPIVSSLARLFQPRNPAPSSGIPVLLSPPPSPTYPGYRPSSSHCLLLQTIPNWNPQTLPAEFAAHAQKRQQKIGVRFIPRKNEPSESATCIRTVMTGLGVAPYQMASGYFLCCPLGLMHTPGLTLFRQWLLDETRADRAAALAPWWLPRGQRDEQYNAQQAHPLD